MGRRSAQEYFGSRLLDQVHKQVVSREWKQAACGLLTLLWYYPRGFAFYAYRRLSRILASNPGK